MREGGRGRGRNATAETFGMQWSQRERSNDFPEHRSAPSLLTRPPITATATVTVAGTSPRRPLRVEQTAR